MVSKAEKLRKIAEEASQKKQKEKDDEKQKKLADIPLARRRGLEKAKTSIKRHLQTIEKQAALGNSNFSISIGEAPDNELVEKFVAEITGESDGLIKLLRKDGFGATSRREYYRATGDDWTGDHWDYYLDIQL